MSRPQLVTDPARSALMRRVRQRGTPPEDAVAKVLVAAGIAYRRNVRTLAGSPDFANKKRRWAVFVHGCFWHGHRGCPKATVPKRNREFWQAKLAGNRRRDARAIRALRGAGYRVVLVWACRVKDVERLCRRLSHVLEAPSVDV